MPGRGIHEAGRGSLPAGVCLRSLRAADAERLVAGFAGLSPQTRYLRWFHAKKQLTPAEVADLTHPDHRTREAIAAFSAEGGDLLGVARFVRDAGDGSVADVTVIVGDRHQGRGVGTALLREVSDRARRVGVVRLRADVLYGNRRMLDLAFRLWPAHHSVHRGGGVIEIEFDLTATRRPARGPASAAAA